MEVAEVKSRNGAGRHAAGASAGLAIPGVDTFPGVLEKREAWREAVRRLNACDAKIKSIRDERAKPPISIEERARASLRGEALSRPAAEDASSLLEERQVLFAAVNIAKEALDAAVSAASAELCARFFPEYLRRAKKIAEAAIAFQEAVDAEVSLRQEISRAGFKLTAPIAEFPALRAYFGRPGDANCASYPLGRLMKALREHGVEVGETRQGDS